MPPFYEGLLIGLFLGCIGGFIIHGLLAMSKDTEERAKDLRFDDREEAEPIKYRNRRHGRCYLSKSDNITG